MRNIHQAASLLITVVVLAGCSTQSSQSYRDNGSPDDCGPLLTDVMNQTRAGDSSDRLNEGWALLSENCPSEFEIAADYAAGATKALGVQSCDELADFSRPESVKMLYQDGYCDDIPTPMDWPSDGIGWDSAKEYAGTYQRICGPVTSVRNTYDGAFVNVGLDYPDTGRFTFIMWNFQLEPIAPGITVCAAGNIYVYEGVAQMELGSPAELESWK